MVFSGQEWEKNRAMFVKCLMKAILMANPAVRGNINT